jgi:hypothetical protein
VRQYVAKRHFGAIMKTTLISWFLVIETGRLLLHPEPHMEPKRYYEFHISGSDVDGGRKACAAARDQLLKWGVNAECQEIP